MTPGDPKVSTENTNGIKQWTLLTAVADERIQHNLGIPRRGRLASCHFEKGLTELETQTSRVLASSWALSVRVRHRHGDIQGQGAEFKPSGSTWSVVG